MNRFLVLFICFTISAQAQYSFRKYQHVKKFYSGIAKQATEICLENNIPPAALLAIAGLESGWDSGYVGQITGNILSLNSIRKSSQLPPLYLPTLIKSNRVLFDSLEIKKYSDNELQWKQRPSSYKKDYRPKPWKGTTYNLGYFKNFPKEKARANLQNITEFVTSFIGRKSRLRAYRDSRKQMDSLVAKFGKEILLKEETAITFVNGIGGKKNSYNFRETWPKKVISIMKKAGLEQLTTQLHQGKSFDESWTQKK